MWSVEVDGEDAQGGAPDTYWRDKLSDPEPWSEFVDYCRVDVEVMRDALTRLESYAALPQQERTLWRLDLAINDRGLPVDHSYVAHASSIMAEANARTLGELAELTGCANPNSVPQLKRWLAEQGADMPSLAEEAVAAALEHDYLPTNIRQALILKARLSGAGPKKLASIEAQTSTDGRLRNQLVFYGSRTGRWTSRGVQVQNLPRPDHQLTDMIGDLTETIRSGGQLPADLDISSCVTSTIRSAFRASPEHHLVVADYSSIENRILA